MSIPRFDILSAQQSLEGHRLLEASAGTGKTFAIENYIVRVLLESPLTIEQFLVVTFTKAAANDLKTRIRASLENTYQALRTRAADNGYEYLKAFFEKGGDAVRLAQQKMRLSLLSFDNASIYTLHAFCQKILSEQGVMSPEEGLLKKSDVRRLIVDFIRTELKPEWIHPEESARVWRKGTDDAIKKIEDVITKGTALPAFPSFCESAEKFCRMISAWRKVYDFQEDKILEDFKVLVQNCKVFDRTKKNIRPEILEPVQRFASILAKEPTQEDFVLLIKDGLVWKECQEETNKRKKELEPYSWNYPELNQWIHEQLWPLLVPHIHSQFILIRLAAKAQQLLRTYMEHERRYTYDEIVRQMGEAVNIPELGNELRNKYQLVIVDEFQDTDPIQWRILRRLFLNAEYPWEGRLVLVGDPKQSIYAFRQADIYTYLDAKETLGASAFASLDTNFRSHPRLIQALNRLFDNQRLPDLIYLPQQGISIECPPVHAGANPEKMTLLPESEIGIDWVVTNGGSKKSPYAFIASEIVRLRNLYHTPFHSFAILIKDRYQGKNIAEYLTKRGIPCNVQRDRSLLDSPAYSAMKELLTAITHHRDIRLIKIALGGNILGWSYQDVLTLEEPEKLAEVLKLFTEWHRLLQNAGFAACFHHIMDTSHYGERLLQREEGEQLFLDILQIGELLLEQQGPHHLSPDELLNLFDSFEEMEENEEASLAASKSAEQLGVTITTIHSSKGLEYDIVFAIGTADKTREAEPVVVQHQTEERLTKPLLKDSPEYEKHSQELDAEKMRQLYVAATRAKYKLYLFAKAADKQSSLGTGGLMELYLRQASLLPTVENIRTLVHDMDKGAELMRVHEVTETFEEIIGPASLEEVIPTSLIPPPTLSIAYPALYISSFSSLTSHAAQVIAGFSPPKETVVPVMNAHTLPAGADTGVFLHTLLENLNFKEAIDKDNLKVILEPYFVQHPLVEWKNVIIDIIHAAATVSLGEFSLQDIHPQHCYREVEFLYASDSPELMKGFVDLFFAHNNKYYFLDWKSNWLGPDETYYAQNNLKTAMEANHYFLQAKIYAEALKRYLQLVDSRPFEECFGGYYYLFLRGLPTGKGIFHAISF